MKPQVDLQVAPDLVGVPPKADFLRWAGIALAGYPRPAELSIRVVDTAESAALNKRYRHKAGPTNVLSFPAQLPETLALPLLGDVVICAPVVMHEAAAQGKASAAHWAHMVVHGVLHLLGYDHIEQADAEAMEALEREALGRLGYPDPYSTPEVTETVHP